MGKLQGKIALVTGASKGIGLGIARGFAREGASLILTARTSPQFEAAERETAALGAAVLAVAADVTNEAQVERLFERARERFGRLDVLVNNAGAFDGGPIDQLSIEAW